MPTITDGSHSQTEGELPTMTSLKRQILQSLKSSKDYRRAFVEESVRTALALQIKAIREQRGMSRPELAAAMKKAPSWIFRLEDPNEKPPTVSTLLEVADAFDTDLCITFGSFTRLLDRVEALSPESFKVPSFDEETADLEKKVAEEARASEHTKFRDFATGNVDPEAFRRIQDEFTKTIRDFVISQPGHMSTLQELAGIYKTTRKRVAAPLPEMVPEDSRTMTTPIARLRIVYRNTNLPQQWSVQEETKQKGIDYRTTLMPQERMA